VSADLLLAIDQGTTSTRAIAFDRTLAVAAAASRPVVTEHPQPGWVEVDATTLLMTVVETVAEVVEAVGGPGRVAAAGIANQGETVVAWDARALEPLAPAVVWQCRRSAPIVDRLRAGGHEARVRRLTGLPLDPYFSAGKVAWLLESCAGVRAAADAGRLRVGTVDAWLTACLGDAGPAGLSDPSTASRTQLLDLGSVGWSDELLDLFGVNVAWLPRLGPSTGILGSIGHASWGGRVPLNALLCDQAAALVGHRRSLAPTLKATYGTGVFVVAEAGDAPVVGDGFETSIGWSTDAGTTYILQGGVLSAGALIDWLRDDLGVLVDLAGTSALASSVPDTAGVAILPALTGLGAPWYRPGARAVVAGLTPGVGRAHLVRAALDAICHRVADIVETMAHMLPAAPTRLRVDGGLTANAYLIERQADLLGMEVEVAAERETTALGTALMAAHGAGVETRVARVDRGAGAGRVHRPSIGVEQRAGEREAWRRFVRTAASL
jgi:glycerol kinase